MQYFMNACSFPRQQLVQKKNLIQNSLKPLGGFPFTSFCFGSLSTLPIVIKALYSNRCRDLQNHRQQSPPPLAVNYCFMCCSLSLAFLESLESFQDSLASGRPVSECNLSFIDIQKLPSKEINGGGAVREGEKETNNNKSKREQMRRNNSKEKRNRCSSYSSQKLYYPVFFCCQRKSVYGDSLHFHVKKHDTFWCSSMLRNNNKLNERNF